MSKAKCQKEGRNKEACRNYAAKSYEKNRIKRLQKAIKRLENSSRYEEAVKALAPEWAEVTGHVPQTLLTCEIRLAAIEEVLETFKKSRKVERENKNQPSSVPKQKPKLRANEVWREAKLAMDFVEVKPQTVYKEELPSKKEVKALSIVKKPPKEASPMKIEDKVKQLARQAAKNDILPKLRAAEAQLNSVIEYKTELVAEAYELRYAELSEQYEEEYKAQREVILKEELYALETETQQQVESISSAVAEATAKAEADFLASVDPERKAREAKAAAKAAKAEATKARKAKAAEAKAAKAKAAKALAAYESFQAKKDISTKHYNKCLNALKATLSKEDISMSSVERKVKALFNCLTPKAPQLKAKGGLVQKPKVSSVNPVFQRVSK